MRPLGIVASTTNPWRRPSVANSPAYLAAPVTFARPSTRDVAVPTYAFINPSRDLLVGLRLRCGARGLHQRPNDGAARELDFEAVMGIGSCALQQQIRSTQEMLSRCRLAPQHRFGLETTPGLVGHAAERQARLADLVALELERSRNRDQ